MAPVMYYKLGQFIFTCQRKMRWGVMTRILDDTNFSLHVAKKYTHRHGVLNHIKTFLYAWNITKGSKKTNMKRVLDLCMWL